VEKKKKCARRTSRTPECEMPKETSRDKTMKQKHESSNLKREMLREGQGGRSWANGGSREGIGWLRSGEERIKKGTVFKEVLGRGEIWGAAVISENAIRFNQAAAQGGRKLAKSSDGGERGRVSRYEQRWSLGMRYEKGRERWGSQGRFIERASETLFCKHSLGGEKAW